MDRPYLLWCLEKLRAEYGSPEHKDPLNPLDELVLKRYPSSISL